MVKVRRSDVNSLTVVLRVNWLVRSFVNVRRLEVKVLTVVLRVNWLVSSLVRVRRSDVNSLTVVLSANWLVNSLVRVSVVKSALVSCSNVFVAKVLDTPRYLVEISYAVCQLALNWDTVR